MLRLFEEAIINAIRTTYALSLLNEDEIEPFCPLFAHLAPLLWEHVETR